MQKMQAVEFGQEGGEKLNGRPVYRVIRCFHFIFTIFTGEIIDVCVHYVRGFSYVALASRHPEPTKPDPEGPGRELEENYRKMDTPGDSGEGENKTNKCVEFQELSIKAKIARHFPRKNGPR